MSFRGEAFWGCAEKAAKSGKRILDEHRQDVLYFNNEPVGRFCANMPQKACRGDFLEKITGRIEREGMPGESAFRGF